MHALPQTSLAATGVEFLIAAAAPDLPLELLNLPCSENKGPDIVDCRRR